jgi:hypothetical protein
MGAYSVVLDVSAQFAGTNWPYFTLDVDGQPMTGPIPVNTSLPEQIGFSFNLTDAVAHTIQIVTAVPNSPGQTLDVQDIRLQGQTISAQSPLETYVSSNGTVQGTGQMTYGGTINFSLPASDFGGPLTSAPPPVTTPPVTSTPPTTPSAPSSIIVGGGSQYTTIQQGIIAAEQAGAHTVLIAPGTYNESDTLTAADNGLTLSAQSSNVTLTGSISVSNASSITISGLTFDGNGSNIAINTLNSQNLTITGDSFNGTGEAVVLNGTGSSTISNNQIVNTANSAIEAMNNAQNDTITNNVITGDNAQETIGAIWLHGTSGDQITHNAISNTAGAGISLDDFYGPGTTATENNNTVIAYNSLTQVDTQGQDSGAIYILGRSQDPMTGDQVTMNFIGPTGSPSVHAVGIYLDDNTSGVTVSRNIVQATPGMSDVFEIHGGSNNTISANIFDLGAGNTTFGLFQQDESDQLPTGSFSQLKNDVVTGNVYATESPTPHDPGFGNLTGGLGNISISANDFWSYAGAALNVGGTGAFGDSAAKYVPPAPAAGSSLSSYSGWSGGGIGFQSINTSLIGPTTASGPA